MQSFHYFLSFSFCLDKWKVFDICYLFIDFHNIIHSVIKILFNLVLNFREKIWLEFLFIYIKIFKSLVSTAITRCDLVLTNYFVVFIVFDDMHTKLSFHFTPGCFSYPLIVSLIFLFINECCNVLHWILHPLLRKFY